MGARGESCWAAAHISGHYLSLSPFIILYFMNQWQTHIATIYTYHQVAPEHDEFNKNVCDHQNLMKHEN